MTTAVSNAVAPADDRPLVSAVKQQAKRLLRLAKKSPLEISALSQALEVASQMHGYPSWHALSVSSGKPGLPERSSRSEPDAKGISSGLIRTSDPGHVDRLAVQARLWARDPKASVNIITPHFQALKKMPGMEGVRFVSTEELLQLNPLAIPVGSRGLLPDHEALFSKLVSALVGNQSEAEYVRFTVSSLVDVMQNQERKSVYAPGLVPQELLHAMELSSKATWNEIRQQYILGGAFDSAASVQSHAGLAMRVNHLVGQMQSELLSKKRSLQYFCGGPLRDEVDAALGRWSKSGQVGLPANGVVVFELDIANVDWTLSPEHQWLLAAYLGHVRRLPSAIVRERADLPEKSYSINDQDMVWLRSIDPKERDAVFAWYESQVPELIFDVWDEFNGPIRSSWVKEFSDSVFRAIRQFHGETTRVVTWVGYQRSPQGEVPYSILDTALARSFRGQ